MGTVDALINMEIAISVLSRMDKEISMAYSFGRMEIFMMGTGKIIIKTDTAHSITRLRVNHILVSGSKTRYISLIIKKKRKAKKLMGSC